MYNEKFDFFKKNFLNDPKVESLMLELSKEFEKRFKEEIIDQLEEEEVCEGIEIIYSLSRDDFDPEDFTIFEIFLFKQDF